MESHRYYQVAHTPDLWKHETRPMQFMLVVDYFSDKYVGENHISQLINVIRGKEYTLKVDWSGTRYFEIIIY